MINILPERLRERGGEELVAFHIYRVRVNFACIRGVQQLHPFPRISSELRRRGKVKKATLVRTLSKAYVSTSRKPKKGKQLYNTCLSSLSLSLSLSLSPSPHLSLSLIVYSVVLKASNNMRKWLWRPWFLGEWKNPRPGFPLPQTPSSAESALAFTSIKS